jgi:hypothetical protein
MAEINKIPQFNVAEFLAKRREASSRETTGTNYVDLLRQGSAQNQGYSTSGSFAGVQQPQQFQQPGIMPGQRAESAIGNNYVGTQGNLWNATVGTLEDISQNILGGVFGVAEGLIDALAGVGGAVVGGLGGKTEGFEDFIKNRWSDNAAAFAPRVFYGIFNPETYTSMVDDISSGNFNFGEFIDGKYSASKYSIINAQPGRTSFVEDVSQGVGQLLPLVGLTILTPKKKEFLCMDRGRIEKVFTFLKSGAILKRVKRLAHFSWHKHILRKLSGRLLQYLQHLWAKLGFLLHGFS